ncbi:MAG: helix-turn-helix domain-containing protein [Actinomycetota bacterium]|nr:helix-turn-helix domain-containing protein [Actinomycetota bacterium]
MDDNDRLLSVGEAAEYLNVGERFIRRVVADRRIPFVKVGKYVRLKKSALDAFIEANTVVPDEPPRDTRNP